MIKNRKFHCLIVGTISCGFRGGSVGHGEIDTSLSKQDQRVLLGNLSFDSPVEAQFFKQSGVRGLMFVCDKSVPPL